MTKDPNKLSPSDQILAQALEWKQGYLAALDEKNELKGEYERVMMDYRDLKSEYENLSVERREERLEAGKDYECMKHKCDRQEIDLGNLQQVIKERDDKIGVMKLDRDALQCERDGWKHRCEAMEEDELYRLQFLVDLLAKGHGYSE